MPDFTADQIAKKQLQLREEVRQREELLKAYDLVMSDLNGENTPAQPVGAPSASGPRSTATNGAAPYATGYGRNTHLVRNAMDELHQDFTIKDVYSHLMMLYPDISLDSVTTVINRLRDRGEIRVKRIGKGRRATVFHKYEVT